MWQLFWNGSNSILLNDWDSSHEDEISGKNPSWEAKITQMEIPLLHELNTIFFLLVLLKISENVFVHTFFGISQAANSLGYMYHTNVMRKKLNSNFQKLTKHS